MVRRVFRNGNLEDFFNQTLFVLIPKVATLELITLFRPISLCTVPYKILSKVIVNRLKLVMPILVAKNQTCFVGGRHLMDNIVIAQEVIRLMRVQKGKKGWITIKIDLEKAYDRLRLELIKDTFEDAKIRNNIVRIIVQFVLTSTMQILWNKKFTDEFKPTRGIRQGDLISLFVLAMEKLGQAINLAVSNGKWKPITLGRRGPPLSHLFFAEGLINSVYGHKVNSSKSKVCFSANMNITVRRMSRNQTKDLGNYLGVPLFHRRIKKSAFQFVIDKVQRKLNGCDAKLLSMAGRTTLAKLVLLAIPGYFMQFAMIPIGTCEKIEQIVKQFVWGSTSNGNKTTLVKWDTCCQPTMTGASICGDWYLIVSPS
ncbi:Retrovirus-related Pol polyprotein LINE-1 [Gossypium australe]|uniref:Retrovirus-related Pol polyprotein LINE-1 n=1 Tax=Gossypium australe TaxID=47621 RepID=A0A5B6VQE3_9ROSI|nr:Retrovirus-related Pol polyprotein LINE-1 [Gossypium australe]